MAKEVKKHSDPAFDLEMYQVI